MTELELDKLILHFKQSNRAEGKSPKIVSWYEEMLCVFPRYLESSGIIPILANFNLENVRAFIVSEQNRGLSPYTVQARVRAMKAFSSWLFGEQYTQENMLANLKMPKAPVRMIEPLSTEEIDRLITTQNPLISIGSRNIAILITF